MTQQSELNLQGIDFEEGYIAVIDKPLEWTSSDVVRKIKFALRRAGYPKIMVGHAGTLDPLATASCWSASARRPKWRTPCKPRRKSTSPT